MRTLVFCTTHAVTPSAWERRYRTWLRAVQRPALGATTILLVDDGSETLPGWPGVAVRCGHALEDAARLPPRPGVMLYHFGKRLGRAAIYDFPGWHRSFAFGALFGEAHGFDRVVHLESDAHLISPRAHDWVRSVADAWAAPWCDKYNFPEIAVQVAAGSGVRAMADFARLPYDALRNEVHETALPLTHVERGLTGGRYGEDHDQIPSEADYSAQVQVWREPAYYWWLEGGAPNPAAPLIHWRFGREGGMAAPLVEGWSAAEAEHRWMLGLESVLLLPPLPPGRAFTLLLDFMPHIRPNWPRQRLIVFVNDTPAGEHDLTSTSFAGFVLPGAALRRDGTDRLRFLHPDARTPHALAGIDDRRLLSVALLGLKIFPAAA